MRTPSNTYLQALALFIAATCVLSGIGAVDLSPSSNTCTGTIERAQGEHRDTLECSGPNCCEAKLASYADRDYLFCACDASVQPDCCYTILWLDGQGRTDYPDAMGACNGTDENCDTGDCGYSHTQKQGVCE